MNSRGSSVVDHCLFYKSEAGAAGGAVYVCTSSSGLSLTDSEFNNSKAYNAGGALYFSSSHSGSYVNVAFSHLKFVSNSVGTISLTVGSDIHYTYRWSSSFSEGCFSYCSSTSSSPQIYEEGVGSHDSWMSHIPSLSGLAGWIVAIIVIAVCLVVFTPLIICICFCCACACFSGRKQRGSSYVQMPQPAQTQVYVQGYAPPQTQFQPQQQYPAMMPQGYPTQQYTMQGQVGATTLPAPISFEKPT